MIPGLRGHNISSICSGNVFSAVVTAAGELFVWGSFRVSFFLPYNKSVNRSSLQNSYGSVTLPSGERYFQCPTSPFGPAPETKVASVTCGGNHLLIISTTGDLYAWGINEDNLLGISSHEENVFGSPIKINLPHSRRVVRVAAGRWHSFAIDSLGDVWGWGVNARGQLAMDICESENIIKTPQKVSAMCKGSPILDGSFVVDIACGQFHSLFLLEDGRVFACGRYDGGQLGLDPEDREKHARDWHSISTPREVQFPFPPSEQERIIGIVASSRKSMAWTGSQLFVWGMGQEGELGLGSAKEKKEVYQPTPIDLPEWKPVQVGCGGQHTVALFTKV